MELDAIKAEVALTYSSHGTPQAIASRERIVWLIAEVERLENAKGLYDGPVRPCACGQPCDAAQKLEAAEVAAEENYQGRCAAEGFSQEAEARASRMSDVVKAAWAVDAAYPEHVSTDAWYELRELGRALRALDTNEPGATDE